MDLVHVYPPEGVVAGCGCTIERSGLRVTFRSCAMHGAAEELLDALRGLLPEGWGEGHMDHMPGVLAARLAIAKAEDRHDPAPTDAAPAAGALVVADRVARS